MFGSSRCASASSFHGGGGGGGEKICVCVCVGGGAGGGGNACVCVGYDKRGFLLVLPPFAFCLLPSAGTINVTDTTSG